MSQREKDKDGQRDQSCFQHLRALVGTTRHKPRLLKSCQVPAAAFGQGGCRDCHLLEAEESPVGAESCCQCCDPCTADGIALQTETNRESVRMGQSWHHRWAAGSCLGWKVLISPRKRHLPTTGNRGSQGRRTNTGGSRVGSAIAAHHGSTSPSRQKGQGLPALSPPACHHGCWLSWECDSHGFGILVTGTGPGHSHSSPGAISPPPQVLFPWGMNE